jgi:hypothetical protein
MKKNKKIKGKGEGKRIRTRRRNRGIGWSSERPWERVLNHFYYSGFSQPVARRDFFNGMVEDRSEECKEARIGLLE